MTSMRTPLACVLVAFLLLSRAIAADEPKPGPAMTNRVVFWDERLDSVGQAKNQERLVGWLMGNGFAQAKSESLAKWMQERTAKDDAYGSVVVMAMGYAPANLAEEPGEGVLWIRYLRAGGRIVSIGDLPLNNFEYPDARPLPQGIGQRGYGALGLKGGWNQPYWGRPLRVKPTAQAEEWGIEAVDGAITGFAVESISIPFGTYVVPETGKLGASSWMKNLRPERPWSGLIKICQMFDGRSDAQLRTVWHAAHYVGKPVKVPKLPPPWQAPKTPELSVTMTASGIPGRTEFARGEEVKAVVTVAETTGANTARLELLQGQNVLKEMDAPFGQGENKGFLDATFTLATEPYAFGDYTLKVRAQNGANTLREMALPVGISRMR